MGELIGLRYEGIHEIREFVIIIKQKCLNFPMMIFRLGTATRAAGDDVSLAAGGQMMR